MHPVKLVLLAVCIGVSYSGYQSPSQPAVGVVRVLSEVAPPKPSSSLESLLEPLRGCLRGEPQDALVLGRAFKHWAVLIGRSQEIKDLNHFSVRYKNAVRILLSSTDIEGKYDGKIDKILNAAYKENLGYLHDKNGAITSFEITPKVRSSMVDWANAASWNFYQVFEESMNAPITK